MPAHDPHQHHEQDDGADGDVGAVEPGEHEEGRAVDARAQGQAQFAVGVHVLFGLEDEERTAEQYSERQPEFQCAAMALFQGMVGDGHGHAGTDQQHGIE
ncbi:hypothetical protein D9M71_688440 [compost metagenome]